MLKNFSPFSPADWPAIRNIYICLVLLFRFYEEKIIRPLVEFKEFDRRFNFEPRLKYGWLHLKLYQMFQDLS